MRPRRHAPVLAALALAACDPGPAHAPDPDPAPDPDAPAPVPADAPAPVPADRRCLVDAPAGTESLLARAGGVVFAVATGDPGGPPLLLHRAAGDACDLVLDGEPIAASDLLDVDDRGAVYMFPADAGETAAVSTMLPDESPESMVVRVDPDDRVTRLLSAGRGIWSFGVSPAGAALWVTACGPTGIFAADGVTPAMTPPDTLWQQHPSVLTDDRTFWSVGHRVCPPGDPLTAACGFALVRTTPAGSADVATTLVDTSAGLEQATLTRCGPRVCGQLTDGVLVWDPDGRPLRTLSLADARALPGERLAQATGTADGVYLLLTGDRDPRVAFVPLD
jgi:hypothetical protein